MAVTKTYRKIDADTVEITETIVNKRVVKKLSFEEENARFDAKKAENQKALDTLK